MDFMVDTIYSDSISWVLFYVYLLVTKEIQMIKCDHKFIVTSWKISDHSHKAQEIMCERCLVCLEGDEINLLRNAKRECFKAVSDHIKFMESLASTHFTEEATPEAHTS